LRKLYVKGRSNLPQRKNQRVLVSCLREIKMERWRKKRPKVYTVDLTKIPNIRNQKEGTFHCPKCGALISPADETEKNYQITHTEVKNDELAELAIECKKCNATIRLVGFLPQPE
jgi:hypothetical protein